MITNKTAMKYGGQKRNQAARKMNLFTTLAELWNYDSLNLFSKKYSFFEQLYSHPCIIAALLSHLIDWTKFYHNTSFCIAKQLFLSWNFWKTGR